MFLRLAHVTKQYALQAFVVVTGVKIILFYFMCLPAVPAEDRQEH